MTLIRTKTNPANLKMQKNDIYVARNHKRKAYWENLRSSHIINGELARAWVKKGIAELV